MKLSSFLVGIVMFSLIVGALVIPYGNLGKNYEIDVDTSFNETFNKIQSIENSSLSIGGDIQTEDPGALDVFFLAGRTILSAPKTVFQSLGIVTSLLNAEGALVQKLGIPPIFLDAMLTIITLAVAFAVISLWARFKT